VTDGVDVEVRLADMIALLFIARQGVTEVSIERKRRKKHVVN